MSQFNHDLPNANLHIAEFMNEISSAGETYSEIVGKKFNLYSTPSCPLFKYYMETSRGEREEEKNFTAEPVRTMDLNNYNKLFNSGRWSNKYPKDAQILFLVGVAQNIADESTKSSDKSNTSNRESTKG